jgi:hypothetical protein
MKPTKKNLELCIPRISVNIRKDLIFKIFCGLKLGYIERITEIPLKMNPNYKRIIIKIKWNPTTDQAKYIHTRILNLEPVFIVYDSLWYWKVVPNQMPTAIIPPPAYQPAYQPTISDVS